MRYSWGLCSLIFLFPAAAPAGNDCKGPTTGQISDSNFSFTYESWRKHNTANRARPFYRFERCLYNEHSQALWFDWEKTGLENRIVEGGDSAVIFFDEERDDQQETNKDLWYGPAPAKIDASTVLRSKEAALLRSRLWLAQDTSGPTPTDIFMNPETLADELTLLGAEGILRSSGTKVTIPADAGIGERVRKENGDVANGDLLGVWIVLRERVFLGAAGPESKIELIVDAALADYGEFVERGNDPPMFRIDTEVEALHSRLSGLGSVIELSRDSPFFAGDNSIRLVLAEEGSVPLEGGDTPSEGAIVVTFGKAEVSATFPVMLSHYAGSF